MRAKREEERQAREKVGSHYNLLQGEQDSESEDISPPAEEAAGDGADWLEELRNDPYVTEAEMIINDLATLITDSP